MNATNLVDRLRDHVLNQPDATVYVSDASAVSFKQLDERANQLAHALLANGVVRGSRVAILSRSQLHSAVLILATMKIGACCVPVNWRLSAQEIRYIVEDATASILVCDSEFLPQVESATIDLGIRLLLTDGATDTAVQIDAWSTGFGTALAPQTIDENDEALHMYSSGTTGRPKGVVLTHRGLMSSCEATTSAWQLDHASVVGHVLPIFHIAGLLMLIFPIYTGCRCVNFREFQPQQLLVSLSEWKISHLLLVPAMIGFLLAQRPERALDFSHLKLIAYGGSPITESVLRAGMAMFGCGFSQICGLTEVCGTVTNLTPEDHLAGDRLLRSAGKPMRHIELRIVDPGTLKDVPNGQVGEIWIRSRRTFKTYWRNPTATADAYPESREATGGWFRSGDAGYSVDGYLYVSDRIKDMVVTGGENVYPAEVENTLMKHPAAADCAIIGVPDATWGESVKACVVLRADAEANAQDLIDFMRSEIAHFKCPRTVDFMPALPRTESGKLLKRTLREPYWRAHERAVN